MGSRSIASIPARPAPSARRACSLPAPPSWAYPRKRRSGRTLLGLAARQCHLPHGGRVGGRLRRGLPGLGKGLGGSPASWWRQAAGPGGPYFTERPSGRTLTPSPPGRSGMDKARSGETMKLGAFFHPTGNHVAAWLHPDAQIDAGTNFRHYAEITQTAERSTASCGTASSPTSRPASATDIGFTVPTIPPTAGAANPTNCCWTRTRRRLMAPSSGTSRCSGTTSAIPTAATTTTRRPPWPSAW